MGQQCSVIQTKLSTSFETEDLGWYTVLVAAQKPPDFNPQALEPMPWGLLKICPWVLQGKRLYCRPRGPAVLGQSYTPSRRDTDYC